jgi:hypothetical protein
VRRPAQGGQAVGEVALFVVGKDDGGEHAGEGGQ